MNYKNCTSAFGVLVCLTALLFTPGAQAVESGTKVAFSEEASLPSTSRFSASVSVGAAVATLPTTGMHLRNNSLAGWLVTVTVGGITLSGSADGKGVVTAPFDCKLTGNGQVMQLSIDGQNLDKGLPLDVSEGKHSVNVEIKVLASNNNGTPTTVVLFDQPNVTLDYIVKKGKVKGKN